MADEVLGWALNDGCHLHPEPEPVFKCPRCHAVRPRSEWGSRYGIATCQGCLSKGYVILPETLHGEQPREGEVPK